MNTFIQDIIVLLENCKYYHFSFFPLCFDLFKEIKRTQPQAAPQVREEDQISPQYNFPHPINFDPT